jgi:hypothetical protein
MQLLGVVILVLLLAPIYYAYRGVKSGKIRKDLAMFAYAEGVGLGVCFILLASIFIGVLGMVFGVIV